MVGQGLIADDAGWCQCIEANLAGRMKDRPFSSPRVQRKTDMGHCILPFLMEEHEIAMLQCVPAGSVVSGRRPLLARIPWNVQAAEGAGQLRQATACLLYTSPSPRDVEESRMPSSA